MWNKRDEDYVMSIFYFVDKILASNKVVVLFHHDDPQFLKEIWSYLESYHC